MSTQTNYEMLWAKDHHHAFSAVSAMPEHHLQAMRRLLDRLFYTGASYAEAKAALAQLAYDHRQALRAGV